MTLVCDGRPPAFASPVPMSRAWKGSEKKFAAALPKIFDTGGFTNDGPLVRAFEEKIAALQGVCHCIAVSNCTMGLQIALRAMNITGKVLMPSFTFIGTAHAAAWIGLEPVFCDIDPVTLTLDPDDAARKMQPGVSCMLPVHLYGQACDTERIESVANALGLRTLYDAAHVVGGAVNGQPIGPQGDMQVVSFHATKLLHTFEGGAILTDNAELAQRARMMRNFGIRGYEHIESVGINAKMTDVAAAHGLACFSDLPEMTAINHRNHACYERGLAGVPGVRLHRPSPTVTWNAQYLVLMIDERSFGMSRDVLHRLLLAENIQARRYFAPGCHRLAPYDDEPRNAVGSLPVTERIAEQILCMPTGSWVTEETIEKICRIIGEASRRPDDVRAWDATTTMARRLVTA